MYTMKSASRALPAQVAPLALALAACVGVPQTGHAQSVIVPAGTTLTVDPGSPYEGHVFSVRGTLNLNGVSVGRVGAREGGVVNATDTTITSNVSGAGASITNSQGRFLRSEIVNTNASGVGLSTSALLIPTPLPLSFVQLIDSKVSGAAIGAQASGGGTIVAERSTFSGAIGMRSLAGSIELRDGSAAIGSDIGLLLGNSRLSQPTYADPAD